jgi:parvulin-like peptidyl-prolyl isomerase
MNRKAIQLAIARAAILVALLALTVGCQGSPGSGAGDAYEAGGKSDERVVAEVNGRPIRASRLEAIVEAERLRFDSHPGDLTDEEELELRRESLDLAIRGELVYQAAIDRGMTVPAEAIEEQLRVARSQFVSEEEYLAYLHEAGTTTDDLRREARRRLLMEAYASIVTKGLEGDAARARTLYEEGADQFRQGAEIRVAQILVRLRPEDTDERRRVARQKIDEAWTRVQAGEDFAELAREYSESPLAERGGDMGFIPLGRMLPEFEDVVFATEVGQVTPVFETAHGFNVVKVIERKDSRRRSFEEVKTGLMLVLTRDKKDEALHEHVEELLRQADVRILDPALE